MKYINMYYILSSMTKSVLLVHCAYPYLCPVAWDTRMYQLTVRTKRVLGNRNLWLSECLPVSVCRVRVMEWRAVSSFSSFLELFLNCKTSTSVLLPIDLVCQKWSSRKRKLKPFVNDAEPKEWKGWVQGKVSFSAFCFSDSIPFISTALLKL